MKKALLLALVALLPLCGFAQQADFKALVNTPLDKRTLMPANLFSTNPSKDLKRIARAEEEEVTFLFDPQGEEKFYIMSLYSYSMNNAQFKNASSVKSQIRFDADGKTVYFKDITTSLGVETWLQGTLDGDTIRIPYGQPLAYYRGKYLIFFCPMIYDDSTGNMEAQDELKLIVKGDSILSPTFEKAGVFQGGAGYVYINDQQQGSLSFDLDYKMARVTTPAISIPTDIEPVEYVYTYENSQGNLTKSKVNVLHRDNDFYMQLSTSAPDAYIYGILDGDSISIPDKQFIHDNTFIYYYNLADPVYNEEGELDDFVLTANNKKFRWDPETRSITSSEVFGVDYMDGMEYCMNYVFNPRLDVYAGDRPAVPARPEWRSLNLDTDYPYISFLLYALDVNGEYINPDYITYNIYFDDEIYTFVPGTYMNVKEEMTDVPYSFKDSFDFYIYDTLHYVYLYEDMYTTVGVQSIYTVDGVEHRSDIIVYNRDTDESSVIEVNNEPDGINTVLAPTATTSYDLLGRRMSAPRGLYISNGKVRINSL